MSKNRRKNSRKSVHDNIEISIDETLGDDLSLISQRFENSPQVMRTLGSQESLIPLGITDDPFAHITTPPAHHVNPSTPPRSTRSPKKAPVIRRPSKTKIESLSVPGMTIPWNPEY